MKHFGDKHIMSNAQRAQRMHQFLKGAEHLSFPWFTFRRYLSFQPHTRKLVECMKLTQFIGQDDQADSDLLKAPHKKILNQCADVLNAYRQAYRIGVPIDL